MATHNAIAPGAGAEIERRYLNGESQSRIADALGLTQGGISNYLRRHGVKRPSEREPPKGFKQCSGCKKVLATDQFGVHRQGKGGLNPRCRGCRRLHNASSRSGLRAKVKARFGISLEEYDALKAATPLCAICGDSNPSHLDHSHATGKIRAFLCPGCNLGLGHFRDDPERLRAAADYLEAHHE